MLDSELVPPGSGDFYSDNTENGTMPNGLFYGDFDKLYAAMHQFMNHYYYVPPDSVDLMLADEVLVDFDKDLSAFAPPPSNPVTKDSFLIRVLVDSPNDFRGDEGTDETFELRLFLDPPDAAPVHVKTLAIAANTRVFEPIQFELDKSHFMGQYPFILELVRGADDVIATDTFTIYKP